MSWKRHPLPSGPVPDWLPDWRDPEPYSPHEDRLIWAWEFLMRNPEYIADYDAFMAVPGYWPEGGKTPKFSGRSFAPWAGMEYYAADPPALPGETLDEYENRLEGQEYSVTNLESWLCRKWGVEVLNRPGAEMMAICRDPSIPPVITSEQHVVVLHHDGRPQDILEPLAEIHLAIYERRQPDFRHVMAFFKATYHSSPMRAIVSIHPADPETNEKILVPVWFDPLENIDRQLTETGEMLLEERERHSKWNYPDGTQVKLRPTKNAGGPQLKSLPTALRVYDAVWRGAERKEIEKLIFDTSKGPSRAEKQQKAYDRSLDLARRLVAGGYRDLLTRG
ncbi:MAG: DUF2285 domain-containing protein [Zoogloeaceae bacterium]|nr:DUF2285 domain-containing protein [Zoogloeaceae bacterium]